MPSTHRCILCKKERQGRFTRHKHSSGRGNILPAWHCWECLPPGDGRDETSETQAPAKPPKQELVSMVPLGVRNVTPDKGEMVKTSSELAVAVNGVMITDQVSYSEADTLLARIQTARKTWNIRMYGTKDKPGPIPQIRSGLDQLYELNREIDQPLEKMEGRVKQAMRDFKLAEARQARELQEAKEAEQARLEEQRLAAEAAAAAARTPQMRGKLEKKVEEIAQQQETVAAVESESPVVGVRSSDRKVKKWRLQHDEEQGSHLGELLMAVIEGKVPEDAILLNVVYINKLYKERPDVVRSWPGIEEYEDVQIVGR